MSQDTPGTESTPPPTEPDAEKSRPARRKGWAQKRREKVVAEIDRNRRGDYKVPTWVLTVALVVLVVGWTTLIVFG